MRLKNILVIMFMCVAGYVQAQQIVFTPQWIPQSQFAGYYAAQELGFYKEAGLDVVIEHTKASEMPLQYIRDGRSNATTLLLFDAMFHYDKGVNLVNILQTSQRSGHMIVPRRDDIKTLENLRGCRVGIWRSAFSQLAQLVDCEHHLNIEWIPFIQSINLFISGAVDATMAMIYNEVYWIKRSGFENVELIDLGKIGYDYPEDGLYISAEYYSKYPEKAKAFAEASRKGWEWVRQNQDEALEMVYRVLEKENVPCNHGHQQWMLQEVLKLQCKPNQTEPDFTIDVDKFNDLSNLLFRHKRISRPITIDELKGKQL